MTEAIKSENWDEEADVIVVGFGFAGASAAIAAQHAGAQVLLLEKAPEESRGGNSRVSANLVFWPNDIEKAKLYFKALAGPFMDEIPEEMIDVWATEMHANRAWLENLGMQPAEYDLVEFPELEGADCVRVLMHGAGEIGEARLWNMIEQIVKTRDIRTLYATGATNLIKENGQIIGVIAEQRGKRITIKAKSGVVLTCGGFENNPAMARNYLDGLPHIFPLGTPYNTGDGIRMGLEVGAELWHMANVSGPLLSFKAPDIPTAMWLNLPHANSYIVVGADSTRFTMEGQACVVSDRHGKVKRHGEWIQQQMPVPIHMIFDEDYRKAGSFGTTSDSWEHLTTHRYDWSDDNLREVSKGWIKQAGTIRELAGIIGQNPDALETSVTRYNTYAAQRQDPDWHRASDRLAPIQTPPYYAMQLTPGFVNTQGGPRRDKDAQVMGVNGKPIPELYSAGELGSIYSFLYQGGGNIGECFAFGRIAGRNAAHKLSF